MSDVELREQIAQDIENEHLPKPTESGVVDGCWQEDRTVSRLYYDVICTHVEDAAIARGKVKA